MFRGSLPLNPGEVRLLTIEVARHHINQDRQWRPPPHTAGLPQRPKALHPPVALSVYVLRRGFIGYTRTGALD
jgi:hypothetical protein